MPLSHIIHPVHFHSHFPHIRLLRVFRHRRFFIFCTTNLISNLGTIAYVLALNWLVLQQYGSRGVAVVVLAYGLCQFLLELPGGIIADHYNRFVVMMVTQSAFLVVSLIPAICTLLNYTPLWMFIGVNGLTGMISAFDSPARTVLVGKVVPPEDLEEAQELYGTIGNATAVVGPILGGICLAYGHVSLSFWVNTFSFIPLLLIMPHLRRNTQVVFSQESAWKSLVNGLEHLRQSSGLRSLLLLTAMIMILGMPYQTLLSIFAKNVLHQGSSAYALLMSISGAGAFIGAAIAAGLPSLNHPGRVLLLSGGGFGLLLLLLSQSTVFWLGMLAVLGASTAGNFSLTMNSGLIQLITPAELRGRVAGITYLCKGMLSVSAAIASALSHWLGLPLTQSLFALGLCLLLLLYRKPLLRLSPVTDM